MKVSATHSALNLLSELKQKYGEKLMFHQSGGCCDGSAPMCFQEGEFPLGDNDIKLGEIGGVPFYMNGDQYEKWKHTDLTIDAVKGINMFKKLDVPILGMIENMSYLQTKNKEIIDIFGKGNVKNASKKNSVDFLGEIPIEEKISKNSDSGVPYFIENNDSDTGKKILEIAKKIKNKIS